MCEYCDKIREQEFQERNGIMLNQINIFNKGRSMHYKNGREAKNGDKIILLPSYGPPTIGILYDATVGNDLCNGFIAPIKQGDPCPNLKECLHLDDFLALMPK